MPPLEHPTAPVPIVDAHSPNSIPSCSPSALPLRSTMTPRARRVRAYFAPVDRSTSTPAAFDLARDGQFGLDSPPLGWVDAGWIQNFTRSAETRINTVRAGLKPAPIAQF